MLYVELLSDARTKLTGFFSSLRLLAEGLGQQSELKGSPE